MIKELLHIIIFIAIVVFAQVLVLTISGMFAYKKKGFPIKQGFNQFLWILAIQVIALLVFLFA